MCVVVLCWLVGGLGFGGWCVGVVDVVVSLLFGEVVVVW